MSTSLPPDIQYSMIRNTEGLENAKIMRYGYAIEYDYVLCDEIKFTLETKKIEGLFLAGQINGTSGYEEAAAQGLIAGINAARKVQGKDGVVLDRAESYIGTLIDDLVTKGTNEPYRMFTARAEYRLVLREDNADVRLSEIGYEAGLLSKARYEKMLEKKKNRDYAIELLANNYVGPSNENAVEILERYGETPLKNGVSLKEFMKRPAVTYQDIKTINSEIPSFDRETEEHIEVEVKYEGYIEKEKKMVEEYIS